MLPKVKRFRQEMTASRETRGLITLAVTLVYACPILAVMCLRANQFPIKDRAPKMAITGMFVILIWPLMEGIRLLQSQSFFDTCKAQWWLLNVVLFPASLTVLYRLTWLVFKIRIMEAVSEMQGLLKAGSVDDRKARQTSWFVEHRHLLAPRLWAKVLTALSLWHFVPLLVATLLCPATCGVHPAFLFMLGWLGLYMVIYISYLSFLLFLLRGSVSFSDNFKVCLEFKLAMLATNLFAPPVLVFLVLGTYDVIVSALITAGILLIFSCSATFPVVLSELNRRALLRAGQEPKVLELEEVLAFEDTYDVFFDFLCKEFSSENALFYRAVDDFRAEADDMSDAFFVERASLLWTEYIQADSPFQVNISYSQMKEVGEVLKNLSEVNLNRDAVMAALDIAQKEIFKLMQSDSWKRFIADQEVVSRISHLSRTPASHIKHKPYFSQASASGRNSSADSSSSGSVGRSILEASHQGKNTDENVEVTTLTPF
eukprot:gb/GEZN01005821.1/.p1 GENE.gb/GEZN01005821.1/~~gb/GEZN01005821.1/.p1  ORF type:complete len:486 (-),score=82.52 gb/GEZN01005821.1/:187-1644(-)